MEYSTFHFIPKYTWHLNLNLIQLFIMQTPYKHVFNFWVSKDKSGVCVIVDKMKNFTVLNCV